jgi:hypothetical protein
MVNEGGVSKIPCLHCGGAHRLGMRRCPATGRALGGDPRLLGQIIDRRYRLVRLLGDGPFGAVYKAEHITVGRQVSLRILPAALLANPVLLNRFFREARLMSSISHGRLHPLLDAGLAPEGVAYVAYQYIRGRSLSVALAQDAPMPLDKASTLVCHILEGLDAIHQSGFVHRALAPEAVLLQTTASGAEQAMLTNFGAAAFEDDGQGALPVSSPLVSENYIPPERRRGDPPDRREDLFSAGVLLAAMLSPAGIPRTGGDLIGVGVPPSVEAIVAKAIHPVSSARFASAADMRQALRPFALHGDEDPSSATRTHISDLRALARRERALGILPARLRMAQAQRVFVEQAVGLPILQATHQYTAPALRDELLRRVPGLQRALDASAGTVPLPVVLLAAALEEGDALSKTTDRLFCSAVGEQAGRVMLAGLMPGSSGSVTPEFFLDSVVPSWASRLGGGVARVTHVGRGYGRLEVRDQAEPSLAVCACLVGILSEALGRLGAHGVELNKTSCEAVGDPACVYSFTWG